LDITELQVAAASKVASRVYAGLITRNEGIAILVEGHGINSASASDFIADYKYLMNGKELKRTMSAPAMNYFLEQILVEHGAKGLAQALMSLRLHIEYYEGQSETNMLKMRDVAEKFKTILLEQQSTSTPEQAFDEAVSRALRDPQERRLQRIAEADKVPQVVQSQATGFARNPDIVAETLYRAAGICHKCKRNAPFKRAKDGTPYLEVHHKVQLVHGGEDSLENAMALCPNCHREAHYG
jgi:5-methylcytosine-specific restriction protein A